MSTIKATSSDPLNQLVHIIETVKTSNVKESRTITKDSKLKVAEVLELALENKILAKVGSLFFIIAAGKDIRLNPKGVNGTKKVIAWLEENPEQVAEIATKLIGKEYIKVNKTVVKVFQVIKEMRDGTKSKSKTYAVSDHKDKKLRAKFLKFINAPLG